MSEIFEIDKSAVYKIGSLEILGSDLIHKVADGVRYEKLKEMFVEEECE